MRTVEVRASGIFSSPNKLRLPPGAGGIAENVVIDAEDTWSRRRGFARFGDALDNPASVVSGYLGRIVLLDGTTLKYDSDGFGTWGLYSGTFSPPTGTRMQFLESNGNLYFLTSRGPQVIDSLTGTPQRTGVAGGLDMQLSATGTGGSWNTVNSTVGYVLTWKRTDANQNTHQGSPSFQVRFSNVFTTLQAWARSTATITVTHTAHGFTTGDIIVIAASSDTAAVPNGAKTITVTDVDHYTFTGINAGGASGTLSDGKSGDISLTFTVPDDVVAGNIWELWRTDLTAAAGDPVGGDHRLILARALTSAEKTAGIVTVTDDNPAEFLGEFLYTNAGEETDQQKNDRPPLARFVAQFDGHTLYAYGEEPGLLALQLTDTAGLVADTSTITITQGSTTLIYTFSSAENQGARKFKLFTSFATLAENLEATVGSLVKIVNRDTGNTVFVAHSVSADTDPPGKILFESKVLGAALPTVTANNSTTGNDFTPQVPTSGTTLKFQNSAKKNGVWISKRDQPEAVPRLNFKVFGSANKGITNLVALKEAALIWKEDGIYFISGKSDGKSGKSLVEDQLDPTAILSAQNSLSLLSNSAIGWTLQGVLQAGQGEPAVLSTPQVETELNRISKFARFKALAHGCSYESDGKWYFFVPETSADSVCTIAYIYNKKTTTPVWTTMRKRVAAAYVLASTEAETEDRLFLAHAVDPYILKERKALDTAGSDYLDEDIDCTITAVSTTDHPTLLEADEITPKVVSLVTLSYTYTEPLAAGFLLSKGSKRSKIDRVVNLGGSSYQVTCRNRLSFTTGAGTVSLPIPFILEWAPVTGGDGLSLKQFQFCTIKPKQAGGTFRLGFQSDLQQQREFIDTIIQSKAKGWGFPGWGGAPWGDSTPGRIDALRTELPTDHQICRAETVRLENRYAREAVDILQMSLDYENLSTMSQRTPT